MLNTYYKRKFQKGDMNKFKKYLAKQPGYKVIDSHFKLGSKIHISDFYYAKRMFQNSFFASRYALITAEYILNNNKELFESGKNGKGVTLVGYGLYSALLLSLVEHLLQKRKDSNLLNHGIIKDYESLEFVDNIELKENIIIIVPIAATFSTSVKIFEKLKKDNERDIEKYVNQLKNLELEIEELKINEINIQERYEVSQTRVKELNVQIKELMDKKPLELIFHEPDINILFVSNGLKETEKYESFGIFTNDNTRFKKELEVKILFENSNVRRRQKYFTELPTIWHQNKNCTLCGLDINGLYTSSEELPLYSTDESSVTPSVIFKYPIARKIE